MSEDQSIQLSTGEVTPEQAVAKSKMLRATVLDSIGEIDVRHIMASLVGRAKNGDHSATMAVLQLIGAGVQEQPTVPGNVVQVNVGGRKRVRISAVDAAEVTRRVRVAQLLSIRGTLGPKAISSECEIPTEEIGRVLQHEWFDRNSHGFLLSAIGWKEIGEEAKR